MAELLVPEDGEPELVAELNTRLPDAGFPDAKAGTRVPAPRPAEFLRVVATGGAERDLVTDEPLYVVEGFATTEGGAQRLCAFGVAVLQAAGREGRIGGATAYGVRVVALPANLPMPSVPDRYRYTATISVALRKTTV
ncbi:hypothetical protein ACFVR6_03660 [Microbacterium sp. NPDC058021]|uniref:hypothetical protein n=1 Tax=Microbacterium sp. NPDC058021 TaxID=3346306 RepID=UPI0036DACB92